jgi:hypothetical protein
VSRIEDHFAEALRRAVASEPPVGDPWARFARRVRRERRRRAAAAGLAAVATAVAAWAVAPRLLGRGEGLAPATTGSPSAPATATPSPSPAPSESADTAGWATLAVDEDDYRLRYPPGWRTTVFEGVHEVLAPGQPATAVGEPTLAVTLALLREPYDDPAWASLGPFERGRWSDGRPWVRREVREEGGSRRVETRIDWSTCVPGVTLGPRGQGCERVPSGVRALVVTVHVGSDALWERYGADALRVVDSVTYDGPTGPFVLE